MNNQKKLNVLNEQMLATILFIGSLIISLSITYDSKQKIQRKQRIYTDKSARYTAIFNRIFVIFIVLFYLRIDNENIEINKGSSNNNLLQLQKLIEIITLCTAIVALYITVKSTPDSIATNENPNI